MFFAHRSAVLDRRIASFASLVVGGKVCKAKKTHARVIEGRGKLEYLDLIATEIVSIRIIKNPIK